MTDEQEANNFVLNTQASNTMVTAFRDAIKTKKASNHQNLKTPKLDSAVEEFIKNETAPDAPLTKHFLYAINVQEFRKVLVELNDEDLGLLSDELRETMLENYDHRVRNIKGNSDTPSLTAEQ